MLWFQWMGGFLLLTIYITALFTVCGLTFSKGHTLLGIVGIFLPFLWLIGAVIPAKPGSRYEVESQMATQQQVQQFSR